MPAHFMMTLAKDKIQNLKHCGHLLCEYSFYIRKELRNPAIYLASALIVGLADRYDALRSRRSYKEACSHEKTLAVLAKDDRSGIHGVDWYGDEIWQVFEKHHLRYKEVFESMQS